MNKIFTSLLCLTLLAVVPACKKDQKVATTQEDINTMIELDNTVVFETETDDNDKTIIKF